ncbi:hypothetical protein ACLUWW_03480 [Ligilactobacillus salivarius]
MGFLAKFWTEVVQNFSLILKKMNRKIYVEEVKFYGENDKKVGRIFSDFFGEN